MKAMTFNRICAGLPATTNVVQWGGADVWKVGGKVFAIGGLGTGGDARRRCAVTFKVTPLAFEILKEQPGLRPAPYLASRGMSWIQDYADPGLRDADLEAYIRESYRLVAAGLSRRKRAELGISADDA